jgi:hypothetical protein
MHAPEVAVLGAFIAFSTHSTSRRAIIEDVDQVNNILYFVIDSFIVKVLARLT